MDTALDLLLILHLVGLALLLGGALTGLVNRASAESRGLGHLLWGGALVQLISGVALTGLLEATGSEVNHVKIAVKLIILIAATVITIVFARSTTRSPGMLWALSGLTLITIAIAVLW